MIDDRNGLPDDLSEGFQVKFKNRKARIEFGVDLDAVEGLRESSESIGRVAERRDIVALIMQRPGISTADLVACIANGEHVREIG